MIFELLKSLFRFILKLVGIGFLGIEEFESEENCRKKFNEQFISKKNESGLPLFEGSLNDVCQCYSFLFLILVCRPAKFRRSQMGF